MVNLSNTAKGIQGQPMWPIMKKAKEMEAKGIKVLHFEIGDLLAFQTPYTIVHETARSVLNGETRYTDFMGLPELRDAVCEHIENERGFRPTREQVLIAPANSIIYLAIRCICNPSDEVCYPNPGFPTYEAAIKVASGVVPLPITLVEGHNFRMSAKYLAWKQRFRKNTTLIIANSPSNPTGAVLPKGSVEEIYRIAKEYEAYLLSDETYSRIVYDTTFYSPCVYDQCKETTILLSSFSKVYAMSGFRMGYAVGPPELIEKMGLLQNTIISCLPAFTQRGAIEALTNYSDGGYVERLVVSLKAKRDIIVDGLNSLRGVSCLLPEGAFYAFPNITKTGMTSQEFADLMLEKAGVACLPGNAFGSMGEGYIRFSYATSNEDIKEAIERMRKVLL